MKVSAQISRFYSAHVRCMNSVQHVFLLAIRLYWGYAFLRTGWGKLNNIERTTKFFTSLGIPLPELNVYMAAGAEFLGGICLLLGLGSRIATVPLIFTMAVAYATAHQTALLNVFEEPKKFIAQEPFLFLMVSLIVLLFGAGKYSLDALLARRRN